MVKHKTKKELKRLVSKNQPTIKQLNMMCRHISELITVGVTMNHAIRLLELTADEYANLLTGGSPGPYSAKRIELWSLAAKRVAKKLKPGERIGNHVRVEHGTPRRAFAQLVLDLYHSHKLNRREMNRLVKKYWKLAVIAIEEDRKLGKIGLRSKMHKTPELRWAAGDIRF